MAQLVESNENIERAKVELSKQEQIYAQAKLIQQQTGINVMIAEDAVSCVALGTGKALDNLDSMDKMKK